MLAAVPLPGTASASAWVVAAPPAATAEELFDEGRKDYRLGRFADAIEKWERAYAMSELPDLLYNIALAYRQLHGVSDDVEDLRKAKAVLRNFMVIAERQPDLDATDARVLMEEIDALIAKADSQPRPAGQDPEPGTDPGPKKEPTGPDPGRTLRIAGAATMGAGGALLLTGVALGIFFGLKGQDFKSDLQRAEEAQENGDPCQRGDGQPTTCADAISTARANGRQANLGMGLGLGLGGGLGLAAIATGAVLLVTGNRRTKEWRSGYAGVSVRPWGLGAMVSGRF
jgi:hypothetical protein